MDKTHEEFIKEVKDASSLPAQTCRALSPESEEDISMYADVEKLKETESMSAGDALEEGDKK